MPKKIDFREKDLSKDCCLMKARNTRPYYYSVLMIAVLAGISSMQGAVLTFSTEGEYDANFRKIRNPGGTTQNPLGYLSLTSVNNTGMSVYDVGGAGTVYPLTVGTVLSVSADVRFSHANASFGFFFAPVGGEGPNYLALLNADQSVSTSNEQFRIFGGLDLVSGGVSSEVLNNTSHNTLSLGTFSTISSTYEVLSDTQIRVSLASGSGADAQTFQYDFTVDSIPEAVEIGFRVYNPAGAVEPSLDVDNFTISDPIPEPSAMGLVLAGAAGLILRRRR